MLETDRLLLSRLSFDDCAFIFELVNEPSFKRYIGDRGVRTMEDACEYLETGPIGSYEVHGFGLYRVTLKEDATPLGICGLVMRDEFDYPDLGFAFLKKHWSNGFAYESAMAILDFAKAHLGLSKIIAMADCDNSSSLLLLRNLGFCFRKMVLMPGESEKIGQYFIDIHRDKRH